MRTSITCLGFAGLLALAGCGGSEKAGENAAGEGQESAAAPSASGVAGGEVRMQAGQWEVTTEIAGMAVPGMPKGAEGMVKMTPTTARVCMGEEQVRNPGADQFTGKQPGNCTSEGFSAAGGKVKGTITCKGGPGGDVKMSMDGQFAQTSYEMHMKSEGMGGAMDMTVRGRRVGDCPAGAQR